MDSIREKRNSNIELLRILCCFFVLIEHFCERDAFSGFIYAENNQLCLVGMNLLYSIARSAVNVFVIISGYFLVNNNRRKFGKIISLLFITVLCAEICYILFSILSSDNISVGHIFFLMLPRSYFVYIYIALYAISPFLNIVLTQIDKREYLNLLIWCVLLFSVWSTFINFGLSIINAEGLTDVYTVMQDGSGRGFSIIGFIFMYCLGGYIKRFGNSISTRKLLLCVLLCMCSMTFISLCIPQASSAVLNYDSFFVTKTSHTPNGVRTLKIQYFS